jgi:hypothetical protein
MALILLSRFLSSDSLRNEGFFVPSYAMSGLFRHPLKYQQHSIIGIGGILTNPPSHTTRRAGLPQGHFRWARTGRFLRKF